MRQTAMWMPEVIHYFNRNYPQVEVQIFDGNYDEIYLALPALIRAKMNFVRYGVRVRYKR